MAIAGEAGHTVAQPTGTGAVSGRVRCAARDSGPGDVRQALPGFLELDAHLGDRAVAAAV